MTDNLLVEIFAEELPPKALKTLGESFAASLVASLKREGLASDSAVVTAYATPRRLAAHVTHVVAQAADKSVSQKLMPVSVGLDAAGQPTPALLKKLAALGADAAAVLQLRREGEDKAETLFYDSTAQGATLIEGLQKALEAALSALPIPKVMSYQLEDGWTSVNFVRPAHALLALHGAEVVPVSALGLQSVRLTHGHRFEAARDPIIIEHADLYETALLEQGAVVAAFDKRRAEIAHQLEDAAKKAGADLFPVEDPALLDEVTALTERPHVLIGQFEPEFLAVPQECLILTMKANQKYFPLLDAAGKLTHRFLIVSNLSPADPAAIIGGNERVVRPRLADARFFFEQDCKKTLASRLPALEKVVYHNKLGSQGERSGRVARIARAIVDKLGDDELMAQVETAARLAKADLLTDMVGEFPELQGVMGRYYALNDGLAPEIADAIEDHYKPRFAGDSLPRGPVGRIVALADKLETLVGMFNIGQTPTGDKDPFALRRHALGVIRILTEGGVDLRYDWLISITAHDAFGIDMDNDPPDALVFRLPEFILGRYAVILREQGYTAHEIASVLDSENPPALLSDVPRRLAAVRAFSALPEAEALAAANKRIGNILHQAVRSREVIMGKLGKFTNAEVNARLLKEPAEIALEAALSAVTPKADSAFKAGDYTASLKTLAALRDPVDAFFDQVMVNDVDLDIRTNRLALLTKLHIAMNRVADLSKLSA